MSISVDIGLREASFAVRPTHGKPVTFMVSERDINVARPQTYYTAKRVAPRFVVHLKGSTGDGFSHHTSFEQACARALSRARRYDKAYSVERRVAA